MTIMGEMMELKLAIACLALGMTLAPASIPKKGSDGKWLPDPPQSRPQMEAAPMGAAPVVRYTADSLTIILYRFAFTDKPPIRLDSINGELEKVRRMYSEWSGGRFRFIPKVHPTVFNLKRNLDSYRNNWYAWLDEVKAHIRSTGIDVDNPPKNTVIVFHSQEFGYNSGGGWWNVNLHHVVDWAIIHELMHAVGLHHAAGLEAGSRIIGDGNVSEWVDYGNVYCNMGMGYQLDLNVVYKDFYGWISPEERWHITYSGTYRVYAHDMPERSGTIALTLPSGNGKYTYWVEYRADIDYFQKPGTVLFNLQGYLNKAHNHPLFWDTLSLFLDMTPNSGGFRKDGWWAADWTDGGLAPGQTFTDPWGGFRVTTLRIGGPPLSKYSWAEVKVEMIKAPQGPAAIAPQGKAETPFPDTGPPHPRYNLLGRRLDFQARPPATVLRMDEDGGLK
jgi:hypothetical protein